MQAQFNDIPAAPRPIAPYSHSVLCGPFLFLTGQMPIDPVSNQWVRGDIGNQTLAVMANIKIVLAYSGFSMRNIVQCRVYLSRMDLYEAFNNAYESEFAMAQANLPARTCVAISGLAGGADVEIDAIAWKPLD
ncbi:RidA family protein [Acidiferrobacter thiooxydans]|jgi:2-iminobutanoate/2-iminopropanoate deaminase|uniref:RidA family protein n=1 Tax=Acidiferrobacter thiooxydans TaxID=163359 RepID=A0A1C2G3D4_9GAMM|nr:RidA family protein [Acidiferrobacter thiooxydans]RCN56409.1 RidA family protein [Acidiferrobacter thiooxydans]UEN99031.1 RidA family protein [Acidiferrobacter thiooxydans]